MTIRWKNLPLIVGNSTSVRTLQKLVSESLKVCYDNNNNNNNSQVVTSEALLADHVTVSCMHGSL